MSAGIGFPGLDEEHNKNIHWEPLKRQAGFLGVQNILIPEASGTATR
jgi:hypothetical protein